MSAGLVVVAVAQILTADAVHVGEAEAVGTRVYATAALAGRSGLSSHFLSELDRYSQTTSTRKGLTAYPSPSRAGGMVVEVGDDFRVYSVVSKRAGELCLSSGNIDEAR